MDHMDGVDVVHDVMHVMDVVDVMLHVDGDRSRHWNSHNVRHVRHVLRSSVVKRNLQFVVIEE